MYNDTVLDHLANPRNVGSLCDADGIGQSGNSVDGDKIKIYIKVDNKTLSDVKFKTFGCAAAIAASSMLTVIAMGKTLDEAMNITNEEVAEALGGLPPQKLSCSNIAADALHDAINNYFNQNVQSTTKNEKSSENENEKEELVDTNQELKDSNQIKRYLRHLIMPKISGAGQKKIIQTSILLCAQSIYDCDISLNYMVAAGIGQIYCYLENKKGCEHVLAHVRDLNPEVNIELIEDIHLLENKLSSIENKIDFNILIGNLEFVNKVSNLFIKSTTNEFSKTLIAVSYAWQGYMNLFNSNVSIKEFLAEISEKSSLVENKLYNQDQLGISMSSAFIGVLASVEIIKARLNIGKILKDGIYFNLLEMSFVDNFSVMNIKLENIQNTLNDLYSMENYLKQKLNKTKVLIVGSGGLGSPNAFALAKAGVGTIGLIDFDTVDISNLNRQILHSTSKIGLMKVESAKETLRMINKDVNIEVYATSFSKENAIEIVKNYDIIVDGLDNIPTRYLLNDACFFNKKPLIEAGVLAFYGQVTTIVSGDGPCYRCIFPESKEQGNARSCSETGILGPVAGMAGILQATEVLKMIIGIDSSLKGGLLMYDALETEFELIKVQRNSSCKLCGEDPSILGLGEYTFVCKDTKK